MPPKFSKPPHPDSSPHVIESWTSRYFSAYNKKRQNDNSDQGYNARPPKQPRMTEPLIPEDERHHFELMERDPGRTGFQNNAKYRLEKTIDLPNKSFLKVAESFIKPIENGLANERFYKSLIDIKVNNVSNVEMCKNYNLNKCNIPTSHYPKTGGLSGLGASRIHGCVICYVSIGVIFGHPATNCRLLRFLDKVTKNNAKLAAQKKRQQEAQLTSETPAATSGSSGNPTSLSPDRASPNNSDNNDTDSLDSETVERMSAKLLDTKMDINEQS